MRVLKNILSQLHEYILWLLLSAVLWGWIFGFLTDAPAEKKIVLYADVYACEDKALSIALEELKPEGIRLVQAHSFRYVMFDENALLDADLYIVPESRIGDYRDSLTGEGILVYDAATGEGAALRYLSYLTEEGEVESFYLFLGANSVHLEDGAAEEMAEAFLRLP